MNPALMLSDMACITQGIHLLLGQRLNMLNAES